MYIHPIDLNENCGTFHVYMSRLHYHFHKSDQRTEVSSLSQKVITFDSITGEELCRVG